jgi:hypothetical protein
MLEYLCNGQVDYRVRGIHVRLEVRWDWQALAVAGGASHA